VHGLEQTIYIALGLSLTFAGLGLTVAFGVFAVIGMPILVVGLGLLSAALD
jgi:hypothetical protein